MRSSELQIEQVLPYVSYRLAPTAPAFFMSKPFDLYRALTLVIAPVAATVLRPKA